MQNIYIDIDTDIYSANFESRLHNLKKKMSHFFNIKCLYGIKLEKTLIYTYFSTTWYVTHYHVHYLQKVFCTNAIYFRKISYVNKSLLRDIHTIHFLNNPNILSPAKTFSILQPLELSFHWRLAHKNYKSALPTIARSCDWCCHLSK